MKSKKRIMSVLLVLAMILTYMPAMAFAGDEDGAAGSADGNSEVIVQQDDAGDAIDNGASSAEDLDGSDSQATDVDASGETDVIIENEDADGDAPAPVRGGDPTNNGEEQTRGAGDPAGDESNVARIEDETYATLQDAFDAAHEMTGNVTITLLDDITHVALIHQKEGLNLTFDGNGKTITGQIYIDGDGRFGGADTLTIKDTKFAYDAATYDEAFIYAPSTKTTGKVYTTGKYNYAHNITVEGCEFAGSGDTVAFRVGSGAGANKVTLKNNTVTGGHSFAQLTGVTDITITENTVTGVKNGINISGGAGTASITDNTLTANAEEGYTVRVKDGCSAAVTLEDNTFSGGEGVINSATGGATVTINSGSYTGPLTGSSGMFTVTGGTFSEEVPNVYIPEEYQCVKLDDVYVVREKEPVAAIGETTFTSLQDAFDAAYEMTGDVTVTLLDNITHVAVIHQKEGLNLTFDGNEKTITGQIYIDGDGRFGGADTLTIKDTKFAYDAATYDEAFIYAPNTKTTGKVYTTGKYNYAHNITVEGCEFAGSGDTVAFRVGSGAGANKVTLKNNTVTGGHSFAQLTGVTDITITENTVTGVKNGINISGGAGTASITDNTLTANAEEGYTVRVKDGCSAAVTLEDNTFSGGEGVINSATGGATITINSGSYTGPLTISNSGVIIAKEGSRFDRDVNDFCEEGCICVPDKDNAGMYVVKKGEFVAQIGDLKYETFEEAVSARADDNTVITLLATIAEPYTMSVGDVLKVKKDGKNVTIKGPEGPYVLKSSTPADGVTTYSVVEADIEFTSASGAVSYKAFSNTVVSASGTYKLLKDWAATARIVPGITASNVTLDLNGHTITSTAADTGILLSRDGTTASHKTFSIIDTSENQGGRIIVNPAANTAIQVSGNYNDVVIGEGVTIDGGCIALLKENESLEVNGTINGGDDFAIATNGDTTKNAVININEGADITSNVTAIYLPGTGTTTVSGGTITGATGIYQKSGELNITGGTITGNGAKSDYTYNSNGCYATGDAVVIDNCDYPGGAPVVSISGGTISSDNSKEIGSYTGNGVTNLAQVSSKSSDYTVPDNETWISSETEGMYDLVWAVTVTFKANDSTENEIIKKVAKGRATALDANSFNRSGYMFNGWNTAADGTGTVYEDQAEVTLEDDLVLYAQWWVLHTVTFDSDEGSEVDPQEVPDGEKAVEPIPTKDDKVLLGWYKGDEKFSFDTPITEDIELKAKWVHEEKNLDTTLKDLQDQIDDLRDQIDDLQAQIDNLDNKYATDAEVVDAIAKAKNAIETAQAEVDAAQNDALEGAVEELEAKIAEAKAAVEKAAKDYTDAVADDLQDQIDDLQDQIDKNTAAIAALDDTYATDKELADAIEAAKEEIANAQKAIDDAQDAKTAEDIAEAVKEAKEAADKADAATLEAAKAYTDAKIADLEKKIGDGDSASSELIKQIDDLKTQLLQLSIRNERVSVLVEKKDYQTLTVNWDTSKNTIESQNISYTIYMKESASDEWTVLHDMTCDGSGKPASIDASGLKTGTSYDFYAEPYIMANGKKTTGTESIAVTGKPSLKKAVMKKASGGKRKVKVTYKKVAGADGYQIRYRNWKDVKSKKKLVKGKKLSYTVKKLKAGKYSFYVRAYRIVDGKKVYGPWSSVKRCKVK